MGVNLGRLLLHAGMNIWPGASDRSVMASALPAPTYSWRSPGTRTGDRLSKGSQSLTLALRWVAKAHVQAHMAEAKAQASRLKRINYLFCLCWCRCVQHIEWYLVVLCDSPGCSAPWSMWLVLLYIYACCLGSDGLCL